MVEPCIQQNQHLEMPLHSAYRNCASVSNITFNFCLFVLVNFFRDHMSPACQSYPHHIRDKHTSLFPAHPNQDSQVEGTGWRAAVYSPPNPGAPSSHHHKAAILPGARACIQQNLKYGLRGQSSFHRCLSSATWTKPVPKGKVQGWARRTQAEQGH